MWALTWALTASAQEAPLPDPLEEAALASRRGWIGLGAGAAAFGTGLVVLTVGRGPPGELSTEDPLVSDIRSFGGGVLLVSGLAVGLVGSNWLVEARAWKEQAAEVEVAVSPGGVTVRGRF
jgi:hypothetical protein